MFYVFSSDLSQEKFLFNSVVIFSSASGMCSIKEACQGNAKDEEADELGGGKVRDREEDLYEGVCNHLALKEGRENAGKDWFLDYPAGVCPEKLNNEPPE